MAQTIFVSDIAHRHHLDKGEVHVTFGAPALQSKEFVLVEALQRNCVDFNAQPCLLRGINPFDHLGQAAPAGDIGEFLIVESVERYVHAPDACRIEVVRVFRQLAAVCG